MYPPLEFMSKESADAFGQAARDAFGAAARGIVWAAKGMALHHDPRALEKGKSRLENGPEPR